MIKVPEALTGGNHVETPFRKGKTLRRNGLERDFHTRAFGQMPGLLNLFWRDIRPRPNATKSVQVARQHAGSCSQVEDALPGDTKPFVHNPSIKLLRIDVPVLGIIA